jgi:peptidylprolyl isomerase
MRRVLAVLLAIICAAPASAQPLPAGLDPQNTLLLDTTEGQIVIKLRTDIAPLHAERLKQLAREHFYDNVPFHRVIAGFMAQTGDGQYGNGTGGSKYPDLKAEFSSVPFTRGVVGMARKGNSNDSANSQFFIMFADGLFLNGKYTVIGEVVQGMDVVDKLKKASRHPIPTRSPICRWPPTQNSNPMSPLRLRNVQSMAKRGNYAQISKLDIYLPVQPLS